ncbi:hypothetical protein [Neorhizobium galegae]|uniref:hypothetical protein n=1 Tax=Neorhizobium galegae TaxID=399 RepID=UPI001F1AABAA|nr:hypothetical protein [Neorhizobium galegae]UIK07852.1 hypothetical protein LZK81_25830 [Neorhizobium galegae]
MKQFIGTATTGLPATAGVLLGIRSFTGSGWWLIADVALVIGGFGLLWIGNLLLPTAPKAGRWFIEFWIATALGIMALATYAILFVSLQPLPAWLGSVAGDERIKAVTSAFGGAITAYIALVWTKDIAEGKGYFWPSTQFKDGLEGAWKKMTAPPGRGTKARAAMFDEYIETVGKIGWDFSGRRTRARIIQEHLDGRKA